MDTPGPPDPQVVLARRKRLLTELFFLSKYVEVPQEYRQSHGASDALVEAEDLAVFLADNDLELGKKFNETTLPEVRIELADVPEAEADREHKVIASDDHATKADRVTVTETQGLTGGGVILDDTAARDAEIAKASLIDSTRSPLTISNKSILEVSQSSLMQVKPRLAEIEPVLPHSQPEFNSLVWLLEAKAAPLYDLLEAANKTTDTASWSAALLEQKWIRTIERINHLKAANRWILRQPVKQKAAPRRKAHWDFLIDEMKWMRTDFREERKWKVALAFNIAHAVLAWHQAPDRKTLQISPAPIKHLQSDVEMRDENLDYEPPTPPSGSDDLQTKEHPVRSIDTPGWSSTQTEALMVQSPPLSVVDDGVNVFEMGATEIFAYLPDNRGLSGILPNMPIYCPPVPSDELYLDAADTVPLISTSRYTQSEIKVLPEKKRKRVVQEESRTALNPNSEHSMPQHSRRKSTQLSLSLRPPFIPANIDRREADRKDHRITWTPEADDMLLNLLSEYQFNWDFVAQAMTPPGPIVAVADRKSPWDCFERWVQLDPRSNDVTFTGPHARLVQSRVDDMVRMPKSERPAVRRNYQASKVQQIECKRQRQYSLFDAMRKIQRKRENASKPTVVTKKVSPSDAVKTPPTVPTPQHLSQMKFERDQQIARAFVESKNQQILAMQQQRMQQKAVGQPPTQAQIAQIQAARQTQARAAQAQQAAAAASTGATPNSASTVQQNNRPPNGVPAPQGSRPSLVGQMPPRPTSATTLINGGIAASPGVSTPVNVRLPQGQRLSQEQMNMLIAQGRLPKGLSVTSQLSGISNQATNSPVMAQQQRKLASPHPLNGMNGINGLNGKTVAHATPVAGQLPAQSTLFYLVDSPGIMAPFIPNSLTMLKLGLVHSIKDSIIDSITLADFLLFVLNRQRPRGGGYTDLIGIEQTNDITTVLQALGQRRGKLGRGGEVDMDATAKSFIHEYRAGSFGSFSLDAVHPAALQERLEEESLFFSKRELRRGAKTPAVPLP